MVYNAILNYCVGCVCGQAEMNVCVGIHEYCFVCLLEVFILFIGGIKIVVDLYTYIAWRSIMSCNIFMLLEMVKVLGCQIKLPFCIICE